jgi:hypothetical protein
MPKLNTATDVKRFDKYLTNFSVELMQNESVFKAHRILPTVPVQQRSDFFRIYDQGAFLTPQMKPLADGTQTAAMDYSYTEGQYAIKTWGLHKDTGPQTYANADSDLNLDRRTVSALTRQGLLHQEIQWHQAMFGTGKWSTDLQGVASGPSTGEFIQFSDASSDPIGVMKSAITQQQILSGGFRPNVLTMPRQVFDTLSDHPDIIARLDRGQTTGTAIANEASMAALFGLEEVVVLDAVVNQTGAAGANEILGTKGMLLMYRDSGAGLESPTAAVRFEWARLSQFLTLGNAIYRYEHPLAEGTIRHEIKQAFDYRITAPDLGTFFADVIA